MPNGFGQVVVGARFETRLAIPVRGERGQHQHRRALSSALAPFRSAAFRGRLRRRRCRGASDRARRRSGRSAANASIACRPSAATTTSYDAIVNARRTSRAMSGASSTNSIAAIGVVPPRIARGADRAEAERLRQPALTADCATRSRRPAPSGSAGTRRVLRAPAAPRRSITASTFDSPKKSSPQTRCISC